MLPSRNILPAHWTDNNAPYGVTFAGFTPKDHTDLARGTYNPTATGEFFWGDV